MDLSQNSSSTVSEPTKRSRNGGQTPLRLGRTGGKDGLSAVQSDNFASPELSLGRGVFFAEGGPVSLKLGALINVANLCSILRSKFNEAPRLIYAERFWLHFTDCLRGRPACGRSAIMGFGSRRMSLSNHNSPAKARRSNSSIVLR